MLGVFFAPWHRMALLFFLVLILGIGAFFIFRSYAFSLDDVTLTIESPYEVDTQTPFSFRVVLENRSRIDLHDVVISVRLPKDIILSETEAASVRGNDPFAEISHIPARSKKIVSFELQSDSDPGAVSRLEVRALFQPKDLSATFTLDTTFELLTNALPVKAQLIFPEKIRGGEDFSFSVVAQSNTAQVLKNLRLIVTPPEQFAFLESLPASCEPAKLCWDIAEVSPSRSFEVIVRGQFPDGDFETRFTAQLGAWENASQQFTQYTELEKSLRVEPPLFVLDQWIGDIKNPKGWALEPGKELEIKATYQNVSSGPFENVALKLFLSGKAFDLSSFGASEDFVKEDQGSYRWDPADVFALRFLRPGDPKELRFRITIKDAVPFETLSDANPIVKIKIRAQYAGGLLAERELSFQIATKLTLHQEVIFYGIPGNSNQGPIPPRVDQETTYTVTWHSIGGVNGLRNVTARAILGPAVRFGNLVEPKNAQLSYDGKKREVVWTPGDLLPGSGLISAPKKVVFTITLKPKTIDLGSVPELISQAKITGEDLFTTLFREYEVKDSVFADLPDDGAIGREQAIVQP